MHFIVFYHRSYESNYIRTSIVKSYGVHGKINVSMGEKKSDLVFDIVEFINKRKMSDLSEKRSRPLNHPFTESNEIVFKFTSFENGCHQQK